jgi:dTDP-4-dehydrorhamnose 3,5-epimerase|tara:strand:- start:2580 stop:3128 length:549 start_codon:yes stop_codon:yes gene_type:complete
MKIEPLSIDGAYKITPKKIGDNRGAFSRLFCTKIFEKNRLNANWVQINISQNHEKGTVRGLHYQRPPHAEIKLVRCVHGKVFDVFVDLRKGSSSYGTTCSLTLDSEEFEAVYIPQGCAHGFQTLTNDVELHYMHSEFYMPEYEAGIQLNDPVLNIDWPLPFSVISEKDKIHPMINTVEPIIL